MVSFSIFSLFLVVMISNALVHQLFHRSFSIISIKIAKFTFSICVAAFQGMLGRGTRRAMDPSPVPAAKLVQQLQPVKQQPVPAVVVAAAAKKPTAVLLAKTGNPVAD